MKAGWQRASRLSQVKNVRARKRGGDTRWLACYGRPTRPRR